jgi:outer membrane protein
MITGAVCTLAARQGYGLVRRRDAYSIGMMLAVLGVALVADRVAAQEAPPKLTLEQALQRALKQHPSLARTEAQAEAAHTRIRQAQAGMMPSVVLQGVATDGPLGAPAFGPLGNPANFGALPLSVQGLMGDPLKKQFAGGLNITQTLFDFGRTQHLVAARRGLFQAAQQDAETQKALVLLSVQQTYLNALRAQQLVAVQQENLRQREATVTQARAFVEGQIKAGVDLQLAQANSAEAAVALTGGQNEVRYAFAALNNAMGETTLATYLLDPDGAAGATSTGGAPSAPLPPIEVVVQRAVTQRPEIRSARLQREAAEQSRRGVSSELLPRLDAIASIGAVNPSPAIQNNKDYAVGLAVTIPLYTGGAVEGRIAEEKQKRDVAIAQEREIQELVKLQVSRAWLDVQTREAQVAAAQAQVTAATSSVQLASERYRLQLNTVVELTEAEAIGVRARAQMVDAIYDLRIARAVLDWATGETYRRYARPVSRP